MERKKASDFPPEVMRLFDGYVHGSITRREFLDRAAKFAVGGFTAAAMLESLKPNFAWAQQIAPDDARIRTESVTYASPAGSGTMKGYLAQPAKRAGKLPGVLVIHENRGLNPHIEDVARRFALLNFVAFAPDALTPVGGYPGDEDKAREIFAKLDPKKRVKTSSRLQGF
jgi:carboxymethylenebutenolidase